MRKKMSTPPSLANLCVRCIGKKTRTCEILEELTCLPVDIYQDLLMLWSWKALVVNHKFVGRWLFPYWTHMARSPSREIKKAPLFNPNSRAPRSLKILMSELTLSRIVLEIEPTPRQAIMTLVPMVCAWFGARG